MKKDFQDKDVIQLLERLKEREPAYPASLQEKRREAFLALGILALPHSASQAGGVGEIAGQTAHTASIPMTIGMKITLGFLASVIVGLSTYLGIFVYENRDALRDFLQGVSPTTVLVSPSPYFMETQLATPIFLSTATPTATPSPMGTILAPNSGGADPNANTTSTPTKPGWHYGQTKTPKPKPKP